MKKLFQALSLFLLVFAVACQKEDAVNVSEETTAAVDEMMAGTAAGGSGDSTKLDTGRHCSHANRMKGVTIAFSSLPSAAQQYLVANADTSKIVGIFQVTLPDGTVRYGVRLSDRTHFHFDANGAIVTDPKHGHKGNFTKIAVTDLPQAAQTYLSTNNLTSSVSEVVKITKPDGTVAYGVRLTDNSFVGFDANGNKVELKGPDGRKKRKH